MGRPVFWIGLTLAALSLPAMALAQERQRKRPGSGAGIGGPLLAPQPRKPFVMPAPILDTRNRIIGYGKRPEAGAPFVKPRAAGSVITDADYPPTAFRDGIQGSTQIELSVTPGGSADGCMIDASSGDASLDKASCEAWLRRGRFIPATDANGTAIPGRYRTTANWRIAG